MTRNQLQYHANKEIERANLAKEGETYRSNLAKEQETFRSNVAKETHNINELAHEKEVLKHNQAQLEETKRANLAKEKEQERHNKIQEISGFVDSGLNLIGTIATGGMSSAVKNLTNARDNATRVQVAGIPTTKISIHKKGE